MLIFWAEAQNGVSTIKRDQLLNSIIKQAQLLSLPRRRWDGMTISKYLARIPASEKISTSIQLNAASLLSSGPFSATSSRLASSISSPVIFLGNSAFKKINKRYRTAAGTNLKFVINSDWWIDLCRAITSRIAQHWICFFRTQFLSFDDRCLDINTEENTLKVFLKLHHFALQIRVTNEFYFRSLKLPNILKLIGWTCNHYFISCMTSFF